MSLTPDNLANWFVVREPFSENGLAGVGPSSLLILSARRKRFSSVEETEEVDAVWGAHNAPLLLCLKEHWEFFILA